MDNLNEYATILRAVIEIATILGAVFFAFKRLVGGQIQTHAQIAALVAQVKVIDEKVTKQCKSIETHFKEDATNFANLNESLARLSGMVEGVLVVSGRTKQIPHPDEDANV